MSKGVGGEMVDLKEIDKALKSILVQYMSEPEIADVFREKSEINENIKTQVNPINEDLMEKIDKIIENQIRMEELIRNNLANQEFDLQEKKKIQSENTSLKKQYAIFERPLEIWSGIERLNSENIEYLGKLCGSANVMSILSLGRDEGKVEQLWSYIKDLAMKGNQDMEQIDILATYFEFCIELLNECKAEKYSIFEIAPGSEFNIDFCIRAANSKQIGVVTKTIVKGMRKGDRILFKTIVSVG